MENNHDINLRKVGERIRNARKALNLSQEKAAERASITGQYWSCLELGHDRASVDAYLRIATVLGLTLNDLFYDDAMIMHVRKSFSRDGLLADCTEFEKAVISESLIAFKLILMRCREQ